MIVMTKRKTMRHRGSHMGGGTPTAMQGGFSNVSVLLVACSTYTIPT
jgi:hypothetical protein